MEIISNYIPATLEPLSPSRAESGGLSFENLNGEKVMRGTIVGTTMLLATVLQALAQAPNTIELRQGGQTTLQMNVPFSSVAVADPEIVDALPRSDRTVILVGRKVGASDIMFFIDGNKLYHATVIVSQPVLSGKVYNHNNKKLSDYLAYQCNPVCVRTDDKFEVKSGPEIMIVGGGGAQATGGSINVIVPPGSAPR